MARALCEATGFAHAPGDGFIIPTSVTDADGNFRERGAVSGFDTERYGDLMRELRAAHHRAHVTVPNYRHTQDGDGANEWVVPSTANGVITECNFLGSASHGWPDVRAQIDVLIYVEQSWEVCRPRLLQRQLAKGRTPQEAAARVDSHDWQNYQEAVLAAEHAHVTASGG